MQRKRKHDLHQTDEEKADEKRANVVNLARKRGMDAATLLQVQRRLSDVSVLWHEYKGRTGMRYVYDYRGTVFRKPKDLINKLACHEPDGDGHDDDDNNDDDHGGGSDGDGDGDSQATESQGEPPQPLPTDAGLLRHMLAHFQLLNAPQPSPPPPPPQLEPPRLEPPPPLAQMKALPLQLEPPQLQPPQLEPLQPLAQFQALPPPQLEPPQPLAQFQALPPPLPPVVAQLDHANVGTIQPDELVNCVVAFNVGHKQGLEAVRVQVDNIIAETQRQRDELTAELAEAQRQRDEAQRRQEEARRQRDEAQRQRDEAQRQRDEARRQRDRLQHRLEQLQDKFEDERWALELSRRHWATVRDMAAFARRLRKGDGAEGVAADVARWFATLSGHEATALLGGQGDAADEARRELAGPGAGLAQVTRAADILSIRGGTRFARALWEHLYECL